MIGGVRALLASVLALLAVAPMALAAEQPTSIPGDFANGQSNGFGNIALEPYLRVGKGATPIVAHIALRDLSALQHAATVLVAFNLKGHDTGLVYDGLATADGHAFKPTSTGTVDHGLQLQQYFAPADLLATAKGGTIDLVLKGHATPTTNGQWHIGALVLAFDATWGKVSGADGNSAELYGFTMLMATGLPSAGLAPFHGMGNSWLAVLLMALCAALILFGASVVAGLVRAGRVALPQPSPLYEIPSPRAAAVPVAHATVQARGLPPPRPAPTPPAQPAPLMVFGSEASPAIPSRPVAIQGPRLPPGFVPQPWPASPAATAQRAAAPTDRSAKARARSAEPAPKRRQSGARATGR
jgi:hypothetical protein